MLAPHGRAGTPATRPRCSFPERDRRCRAPSAWTACASGVPAELTGEGIEPGVLDVLPGGAGARRGARRRDQRGGACRTRRMRCRPTTCSRPPRPPRTSPASTASATGCAPRARRTCWTCTPAPATTASGPRSSAGSCSAPTRSPPATTTPTTAAPSACGRRSPRTSRQAFAAGRLHPHPDRPDRRLQARREDRRPAGHVPERLLHGADVAGRHPGDLDPLRPQRTGLPVGLQIAGPAFSENRLLDAAHALEQAIGFDGGSGPCLSRTGASSPSSALRSTSSWRRPRRCSAAASCPSASRPTRAPARSASACPAACRWPTPARCTSA